MAGKGRPKAELLLTGDERETLERWNDDPKAFIWHKTADEILRTLASYCEHISDSGHWP